MTRDLETENLTLIAGMEPREIEQEFVSLAEMQRHIMPDPERVTAFGDYDIFGSTVPTAIIGGDFYDFIDLEERFGLQGRRGIVIADAAGHGLVAAMLIRDFNTALYTAISFEAEYTQDTTSLLFTKINRRMYRSSQTNQFISAFYGEVHRDGPPLLLRRDRIEVLDVGGLVLGAFRSPALEYQVGEIRLSQGDVLVGYTDGIIESLDLEGREYGVETLKKLVWDYRSQTSREIFQAIMTDIELYSGSTGQSDDRTVIVIKKENAGGSSARVLDVEGVN